MGENCSEVPKFGQESHYHLQGNYSWLPSLIMSPLKLDPLMWQQLVWPHGGHTIWVTYMYALLPNLTWRWQWDSSLNMETDHPVFIWFGKWIFFHYDSSELSNICSSFFPVASILLKNAAATLRQFRQTHKLKARDQHRKAGAGYT